MKKEQNETVVRSVKALSRLINNVGGFNTRSEIERRKKLEKQILQMRRMYDILMALPQDKIMKLQAYAIAENYNDGAGRIRVDKGNFLPGFISKYDKLKT